MDINKTSGKVDMGVMAIQAQKVLTDIQAAMTNKDKATVIAGYLAYAAKDPQIQTLVMKNPALGAKITAWKGYLTTMKTIYEKPTVSPGDQTQLANAMTMAKNAIAGLK